MNLELSQFHINNFPSNATVELETCKKNTSFSRITLQKTLLLLRPNGSHNKTGVYERKSWRISHISSTRGTGNARFHPTRSVNTAIYVLSKSESVKFSQIESVICLYTDSTVKKYIFSYLNQSNFTDNQLILTESYLESSLSISIWRIFSLNRDRKGRCGWCIRSGCVEIDCSVRVTIHGEALNCKI